MDQMGTGPEVTVIGTGLADGGTLTVAGREALAGADLVIGASRLLELVPPESRAQCYRGFTPGDIMLLINEHPRARRVCVLMSGDTGFYSGTTKLVPALEAHGCQVRIIPGISSIQALAARLRRPWQDWKLVSAHGRGCDPVPLVRDNRETFFLTGGEKPVSVLVTSLAEAGFGALEACVGEKLGSPEERVFIGSVAEAARQSFDSLAVLLVTNPEPRTLASAGLPDDAFTRGKAPMTKSEVRAVILSKLQIHRHDVVFDVGAGTGSVSVEAALLASAGQVYAVEVEEEACRLIEENARQQGTSNLQVIHGSAPQALTDLPAPDVAFIGGSKGNLRAIMETLLAANPSCRIVASAVTLETIAEATTCFNELGLRDVEAVTVSVSRSRKLGGYHLLTAQNPILILSGTGDGDPTVGETDPLCFEEDR